MYEPPVAKLDDETILTYTQNTRAGIASSCISVLSLLLLLFLIGYYVYKESYSLAFVGMTGTTIIGGLIIGLMLGLIGLFRKKKKRKWAVIGVSMSSLSLGLLALLFAISMYLA